MRKGCTNSQYSYFQLGWYGAFSFVRFRLFQIDFIGESAGCVPIFYGTLALIDKFNGRYVFIVGLDFLNLLIFSSGTSSRYFNLRHLVCFGACINTKKPSLFSWLVFLLFLGSNGCIDFKEGSRRKISPLGSSTHEIVRRRSLVVPIVLPQSLLCCLSTVADPNIKVRVTSFESVLYQFTRRKQMMVGFVAEYFTR